MVFDPTPEQASIVEAYATGQNLVIQAGAGTGKTSTLNLIAQSDPSRRGTYIAFNRAIANEAKRSFPANVKASTAHSLAFQAVGKNYSDRLNAPRQWPREVARFLGLAPMSMKVHGDEQRTLSERALARLVKDMVGNFCKSADTEIGLHHFPLTEGLDGATASGYPRRGPVHNALASHLLPHARTVWADLQKPRGTIKFEHDHYLKMYQLSGPRISGDFLLFDEAQDANPVIAAIVEAQEHLQVILVGDSAQAIYGFTGAVDAMAKFAARGTEVRTLSQSFRFGPKVAEVANAFLDVLDAPLRLTGFDKIPSVRQALDTPGASVSDAVLCRTNAGCLGELIAAQRQGRKAALVGGTNTQVKFIEAVRDLQQGRGTEHADLCAFTSWQMVEQYVAEEETTGDFATMVKMVQTHGVAELLQVLGAATDERYADVIISTAHKAKGREWDAVRIADFALDSDKVGAPDLMLAYVAVTRAKRVLDVGTLQAYLDDTDAPLGPVPTFEETLPAVIAEERDAVDSQDVPVVEAAPLAISVEVVKEQHVVVDITDPARPRPGIRYTLREHADSWIAEHGDPAKTYKVGTMTITESPITL